MVAGENLAAPMARPMGKLALLTLLAALLVATAVPGIFTIDENNYGVTTIGLRHGQFTVHGTSDLTPSTALAYFDPAPRVRKAVSPVGSTAPPLYAFFAWPFSFLGWRGLVALNAISLCVALAAVFRHTALFAKRPATPWLASAALLFGTFVIEYAQGVWPHALSMALVATGLWQLADSAQTGRPSRAFLGGLLLALATGVRYQNAALLLGGGLAGLLVSRGRFRRAFAYGLGALLPLLLSAYVNHVRLDSWNPVSKGTDYLKVDAGRHFDSAFVEGAAVLWAKLVDNTVHPRPGDALHETEGFAFKDSRTGALLSVGALKKAVAQSAPWTLPALVWLFAAYRRPGDRAPLTQERRGLALVIGATLAAFALSGFAKFDGVCFNQRYQLEILPALALALALALEDREVSLKHLLAGALLGAFVSFGLAFRMPLESEVRQLLVLKPPVLLAFLLVVLWHRPLFARFRPAASLLVGTALGWALALHLTQDLRSSRFLRSHNAVRTTAFRQLLPTTPSAVFVYRGSEDPIGPLQYERDVVIVNPWIDRAATTPALIRDFLRQGRRVFVVFDGMPRPMAEELLRDFRVKPVTIRPALAEVTGEANGR